MNLLKKMVMSWIQKNAKEYRIKSKCVIKDYDAEAIYEDWISRGCKFHSPNLREKVFYLEVSKPSIRGTARMTLPMHDLKFSLRYPTRTMIFPQQFGFEKWFAYRKWRHGVPHYVDRHDSISVHPHVAQDGTPCLGDFGNAWSTCIKSGDLPMLKSVTRSFLNNWYRHDAYYNINDAHHLWLTFCDDSLQGHSFSDFLMIIKLTQDIAYMSSDRWLGSPRTFINSFGHPSGSLIGHDNHQGQEFQVLESFGIDALEAMMLKGIAMSSMETISDSDDGSLVEIGRSLHKCSDVYNRLHEGIQGEWYNVMESWKPNTFRPYNFAERALTGHKLPNNPFRVMDSNIVSHAQSTFQSRLHNVPSGGRREYYLMANIDTILDTKRKLDQGKYGEIAVRMHLTWDNIYTEMGMWVRDHLLRENPLNSVIYGTLLFIRRMANHIQDTENDTEGTTGQSPLNFDPEAIRQGCTALLNNEVNETSLNERCIKVGEHMYSALRRLHSWADAYSVASLTAGSLDGFLGVTYSEVQYYLRDIIEGVRSGEEQVKKEESPNREGRADDANTGEGSAQSTLSTF